MDSIQQLVRRNAERPATGNALAAPPSLEVSVVSCMDARLDVYGILGLNQGEAHVLRNAGGLITDDVIRSLAISQLRLGTTEVMLLHHTECGMQTLDESELRRELTQLAGSEPPFSFGAFPDLEGQMRESLRRVRESPYVPHREAVRGFIVDVHTWRLDEVHT